MHAFWLKLVECVLRPARPDLDRCLTLGQRHIEARRVFADGRAQEIAACEARIESARAEIFARKDGIVGARMTDLEREWRRLARRDPEAGLMDLWAEMAPPTWIDRKRWRDVEPGTELDAAIALASDATGVETAEAAATELAVILRGWGLSVGSAIRWRRYERDFEGTSELLAEPRRAIEELLRSREGAVTIERARHLERDVHAAATARFADRPALAGALAAASFVDCLWCLAPSDPRPSEEGAPLRVVGARAPNPVAGLSALWRSGYVLAEIDAGGITLEFPALPPMTAGSSALGSATPQN